MTPKFIVTRVNRWWSKDFDYSAVEIKQPDGQSHQWVIKDQVIEDLMAREALREATDSTTT